MKLSEAYRIGANYGYCQGVNVLQDFKNGQTCVCGIGCAMIGFSGGIMPDDIDEFYYDYINQFTKAPWNILELIVKWNDVLHLPFLDQADLLEIMGY